MNIGEEEYTKVVEDGILTIKGRLLVDIEADLQNAYNEGYEQGKKDASGNIIRCKDCRFWERTTDSLQGICYLLRMNPTGMWYCANARPINDGYQNTMIGEDEITGVWEMLKAAYKVLDAWKMSEIHLDY